MPTAQLPLNKFRLFATALDSGSNLIYRENLDVSTIILSSQVTNVTSSLQRVSVYIEKSGSSFPITLLKNAAIPPEESLNPFAGKIVLEKYDALIMSTYESGSLEVVLSVLENANT
jgi:hypothetical protein